MNFNETVNIPSTESPTKGMNLGERIAHVGGRENDAGYIEFGSVEAVKALINHVLRDIDQTPKSSTQGIDEFITSQIIDFGHPLEYWDDEDGSLIPVSDVVTSFNTFMTDKALLPVEVLTSEWSDKNILIPQEVKGRVMVEMFWRGVLATQQTLLTVSKVNI